MIDSELHSRQEMFVQTWSTYLPTGRLKSIV